MKRGTSPMAGNRGLCFSKLHLHLQVKKLSWGKHFMAATHAAGMSGHVVYPFSSAQLIHFHFTPESTMSIFSHIFFPLNSLTCSLKGVKQSGNFAMAKLYLPKEKSPSTVNRFSTLVCQE